MKSRGLWILIPPVIIFFIILLSPILLYSRLQVTSPTSCSLPFFFSFCLSLHLRPLLPFLLFSSLSFNLFCSLLLSPFLNSPYPIFTFKFWYLHYDIIVSDCCCQAARWAASERQRSNCSHYCWRYYISWSDLIR